MKLSLVLTKIDDFRSARQRSPVELVHLDIRDS
jgi:hypothetical protein